MKKPASNRMLNSLLFILAILVASSYFCLNQPTSNLHFLNTGLDSSIPFVPVFSIPYLLFLPVFWLLFLYAFIKDKKFIALAVTIIVVHLISYLFFAFYQTEVIRPQIVGAGLLNDLVRFVYGHDAPYNDFPSLHSALAAVMAAYFIITKSKWTIISALFAFLVVLSTLFIKQHYLADVIFGLALGAGISALMFKRYDK